MGRVVILNRNCLANSLGLTENLYPNIRFLARVYYVSKI